MKLNQEDLQCKAMRNRRLSIIAVVLLIAAVFASCNKPTERKIIGKWHVQSFWTYDITEGNEGYEAVSNTDGADYEFRADGTLIPYLNGNPGVTLNWVYDEEENTITFGVIPKTFTIVELTDDYMELRYVLYLNGIKAQEDILKFSKTDHSIIIG